MRLTTIEIKCPHCHSPGITRNGKKYNDKQNYLCTQCGRQFTGGHEMTYQGCLSRVVRMVKIMLVRRIGIRDISVVLQISITSKLTTTALRQTSFGTNVGKKRNKIWLIYAYHQESGEIVAYVWGKRDLKTAKKPGKRLRRLGISYDRIATDDWDNFVSAFTEDNHDTGKKYTAGIEGNNCRVRHRIRLAFRRTCCFSRKLRNHRKAFAMAFFYINYSFV